MSDADNRDVEETDELKIVDLDDAVEAGKRQVGGRGRGQRLMRRTQAGLIVLSVIGVVVLLFIIVFSTHIDLPELFPYQQMQKEAVDSNSTVVWKPFDQEIIASHLSNGGPGGIALMEVFQRSNGHLLWKSDAYVDLLTGRVFVANDVLYIELQDGAIQAVHLSTGKVIWQSPVLDGQVQGLQQGIVYILGDSNTIYAMRATDGKLLWKQTSNIIEKAIYQQNTVLVGGGIIAINATNESEVDAWSGSNGKQLWTYKKNDGGWVEAIQNGVAYIISQNHTIDAVKVEDGETLWSYPLVGVDPIESQLVKITSTIIAVSTNGAMTVLRTSDGTKLWSDVSPSGTPGNIMMQSAEQLSGQTNVMFYRYDSNQKTLQALMWESGSVVWTYKGDGPPTNVAEKDSNVYIEYTGYGIKTVVVLDRDSGRILGTYKGPVRNLLIDVNKDILSIYSSERQTIETIQVRDHKVLWQQHLQE